MTERVDVRRLAHLGKALGFQAALQILHYVNGSRTRFGYPEEVIDAGVFHGDIIFGLEIVKLLDEFKVLKEAMTKSNDLPAAQPGEDVGEGDHGIGVIEDHRAGAILIERLGELDEDIEIANQSRPTAGAAGIADGVEDAEFFRDGQVMRHRVQSAGGDGDDHIVGIVQRFGRLIGGNYITLDAYAFADFQQVSTGKITCASIDVVSAAMFSART